MSHSFTDATPMERSVFLLFMLLWIVYGILNQYNSIEGITFDPTTVVWCQEVLKIVLSITLFFVQDGGPVLLCSQAKEHWTMLFWYIIPAGLYALGDVLTYINLRVFDPATLHLLGEMKLVVTAIVHQYLFRRILNKWHWAALAIITAGCILKALDSMELSSAITTEDDNDNNDGDSDGTTPSTIQRPHPTLFNYGLIAFHILISTVAGVFNEKLLKDKPSICINLQNICLYFDGILFLSLGMLAGVSDDHKSITEALSPSSLVVLFSQPSILAMAVIMAIAGLATSRFLKMFDSIRKSVAVALVVVSLPLLSRVFFKTPITPKMVVSMLMVLAGMNLYTSQPPPMREDPDGVLEEHDEGDNKCEEDEAGLFLQAIALPDDIEHSNHNHNGEHMGMLQEIPTLGTSTLSNSVA